VRAAQRGVFQHQVERLVGEEPEIVFPLVPLQ